MSSRVCPLCGGHGHVEVRPWPDTTAQREEAVAQIKELRRAGLSLRQIARALGYKNHNSVIRALAKEGR